MTAADAASEAISEGKVKSALVKINDAAQNWYKPDVSTVKTNQYGSSNGRLAPGEGTAYGELAENNLKREQSEPNEASFAADRTSSEARS